MVTVKRRANPDYGSEKHEGDTVVLPAPNVRQGVTGHNVRYVLALGLGTALFILAVVYFLFFFS